METIKIVLSLNEPAFLPLKNSDKFAGQPDYIGLPPAALPPKMLSQFQQVFTALTGEEMPEETFIQARNQAGKGITKLYGPAIYRGEADNQLQIRWGNTYIPLTLSKGSIVGPVENEDLAFEFSWEKIQYDEPVLLVKLDVDEDLLVLPVVIKDADWNNPIGESGIEQMKRLLAKGKIKEIREMVSEVKTGGGSSNGNPVDPRDMTTGGLYTVTKARPIKTTHGSSYVLSIEPQPGDPAIEKFGETWDMWGHHGINPYVDTVTLPFQFELDHTPNRKDPEKLTARFSLVNEVYKEGAEVVSLASILG